MGSCCSLCFGEKQNFAGEGRRLGTAQERSAQPGATSGLNTSEQNTNISSPEPLHDRNLTDADRERIRAERSAAAEARLKKQSGGTTALKSKKSTETQPLRGPNSQPLMRWSAS